MRLRCLAGRYAGQIQDYSPFAGMSALRTGMAERLTEARPMAIPVTAAAGAAPVAAQSTSGMDHGSRKRKK
jgi:hypothetical protein